MKKILFALLLLLALPLFGDDPGNPGPFAVTREEYNFGDTAFTPTNFPGPVELLASITYPSGLPGGPFPLVVFLHGRHATCFTGRTGFLLWPCSSFSAPLSPIPSYRGYDYLSDILASHGFIVVSISANGINARDNFVRDLGALARAELIQKHLDILNTFNTTGGAPFGTKFVGKIDLTRVGTMGHSRGGEGVVRHFILNASLGSPYGIKAVFPLAPVDFNRPVINNVPLAVLLPYCDGDVADLQGVHFYDDARYNVPGDAAAKHTILVMGANHNFYNTIWTPGIFDAASADDWNAFVPGGRSDPHCGTKKSSARLTPEEQRGTGQAYIVGFFRNYVGGEDFASQFNGDTPPPPSATTDQIFLMYHPPDLFTTRRDVNRLLTAADLGTNTLGGAVSQSGITPYELCGGEAPQPAKCLPAERNSRQPHTTPSARSPKRGLSQLQAGWTSISAFIENGLPRGTRDVSAFRALQFRASVNFGDARNAVGVPQNLTVVLSDRKNSATVNVSNVSRSLYYPPGEVIHVPKLLLNTVRVPLSAFQNIDLTNITSVRFNFDQNNSGALLISDVAFTN
ncbi:MAG TPA: hypothetical protein VII12_00490 [Thermoanaerobaculia bacterium]